MKDNISVDDDVIDYAVDATNQGVSWFAIGFRFGFGFSLATFIIFIVVYMAKWGLDHI